MIESISLVCFLRNLGFGAGIQFCYLCFFFEFLYYKSKTDLKLDICSCEERPAFVLFDCIKRQMRIKWNQVLENKETH